MTPKVVREFAVPCPGHLRAGTQVYLDITRPFFRTQGVVSSWSNWSITKSSCEWLVPFSLPVVRSNGGEEHVPSNAPSDMATVA